MVTKCKKTVVAKTEATWGRDENHMWPKQRQNAVNEICKEL